MFQAGCFLYVAANSSYYVLLVFGQEGRREDIKGI